MRPDAVAPWMSPAARLPLHAPGDTLGPVQHVDAEGGQFGADLVGGGPVLGGAGFGSGL